MEVLPNEKTSQTKGKSKENLKGTAMGNPGGTVESSKRLARKMARVPKTSWAQATVERKTLEKVARKENATATRMAAKQRKAKCDLH